MINNIILASKSGVRKKILNENGISCEVVPANIDEDQIKESLLKEKASPEIISKNLAELKANKVSEKKPVLLVLFVMQQGCWTLEEIGFNSCMKIGPVIISMKKRS